MGIQFTGAAFIAQFPHDRTVEVNVTQSVLQHVDIFYAGTQPRLKIQKYVYTRTDKSGTPKYCHC